MPERRRRSGEDPRRGRRRGRRPQHRAGQRPRPRRRAGRAAPQHRRLVREPRPPQPEPARPPARLHHRAGARGDRPRAPRGLFRLDHLATRMRRNAESLLRLAGGGERAPPVGGPVPIIDVVRGALGEVEDYQRVDVRAPRAGHRQRLGRRRPGPPRSPSCVENALASRPPERAGRGRGAGAPTTAATSLAVIDNGVGMTDEQLGEANRRLAGEESFTVAPSRYLGHYVAGHLAATHGVAHRAARRPPAGGITARIDIPASRAGRPTPRPQPPRAVREPPARRRAEPSGRPGADGRRWRPSRDRSVAAPASPPSRRRPTTSPRSAPGRPTPAVEPEARRRRRPPAARRRSDADGRRRAAAGRRGCRRRTAPAPPRGRRLDAATDGTARRPHQPGAGRAATPALTRLDLRARSRRRHPSSRPAASAEDVGIVLRRLQRRCRAGPGRAPRRRRTEEER